MIIFICPTKSVAREGEKERKRKSLHHSYGQPFHNWRSRPLSPS